MRHYHMPKSYPVNHMQDTLNIFGIIAPNIQKLFAIYHKITHVIKHPQTTYLHNTTCPHAVPHNITSQHVPTPVKKV